MPNTSASADSGKSITVLAGFYPAGMLRVPITDI
jgi:hypothetical protein